MDSHIGGHNFKVVAASCAVGDAPNFMRKNVTFEY